MTAVTHPDPEVRIMLAGNPRLTPEARGVLAEDAALQVQRRTLGIAGTFGVWLRFCDQ